MRLSAPAPGGLLPEHGEEGRRPVALRAQRSAREGVLRVRCSGGSADGGDEALGVQRWASNEGERNRMITSLLGVAWVVCL